MKKGSRLRRNTLPTEKVDYLPVLVVFNALNRLNRQKRAFVGELERRTITKIRNLTSPARASQSSELVCSGSPSFPVGAVSASGKPSETLQGMGSSMHR